MEVARSGKFKLLLIRGFATIENISDAWEEIVRENDKAGGKQQFSNYLETSQAYLQLINEHVLIKALLLKLTILQNDKETIDELANYGYVIDPDDFINSLLNSITASNNILTHIATKKKELELITEEGKAEVVSFEKLLSDAGFALKFPLPQDITLAQFNSYRQTLKEQSRGRGSDRETGLDNG